MGRNKRPRRPYLNKRDSLRRPYSGRQRWWGKFNTSVLLIMALAGAVFVFYMA